MILYMMVIPIMLLKIIFIYPQENGPAERFNGILISAC